jgi:glycerol uptake facilitator-like aquaporin
MQSTHLAANLEDEYSRYTQHTKYHIFMSSSKLKLWVEFIGTFAFVYFGNWSFSVYIMKQQSEASFALFQGMLVFILSTLSISSSGALFNPAITVTIFFSKI